MARRGAAEDAKGSIKNSNGTEDPKDPNSSATASTRGKRRTGNERVAVTNKRQRLTPTAGEPKGSEVSVEHSAASKKLTNPTGKQSTAPQIEDGTHSRHGWRRRALTLPVRLDWTKYSCVC